MRLIYAADLHGEPRAYDGLAELAGAEHADAVLLGGDLFAYHTVAGPQLTFANGPFRRFANRLRDMGVRLLAIPGNVDRPASIGYLRVLQDEGLLWMLSLQPQLLTHPRHSHDAIYVIGYWHVPPTPFRLKDHERRDLASDVYSGPWPVFVSGADTDSQPVEATRDHIDRLPSIEEELAGIPAMARPFILVAHSPPRSRALDLTRAGEHAGSQAVRACILTQRPLLALHGHIHEAPELSGRWAEAIGSTICINPGPAWAEGLQAVLIDTEDPANALLHTRYGPVEHIWIESFH